MRLVCEEARNMIFLRSTSDSTTITPPDQVPSCTSQTDISKKPLVAMPAVVVDACAATMSGFAFEEARALICWARGGGRRCGGTILILLMSRTRVEKDVVHFLAAGT